MKRLQFKRAGFDCRNGNCPACAGGRKGDHGINGGRYCWGVQSDDGLYALVLDLSADEYPETVPEHVRLRQAHDRLSTDPIQKQCAISGSLSVHARLPQKKDDLTKPVEDVACHFLAGPGPCYGDGTFMAGEHVADVLALDAEGRILFDQPEAFWRRMEEKAERWLARARADAEETARWKVCPTCDGETFVPVEAVLVPSVALRALGLLALRQGGALHLDKAEVLGVLPESVKVTVASDGGLNVEVKTS